MRRSFDLCVIFAEMRTGSNHLEAMLDGVPGLLGIGEVYNPSFVGGPNQEVFLGFNMARREAEPEALFDTIKAELAPDIAVLRFFHDHDHRMLAPLLDDPRVAKIVLSRNPLDSYLSRKIAAETGQWRMTDARARKSAEIRFDAAEFEVMLDAWQSFAAKLRRGLQLRGQTAFEIDYEELNDEDVLNGLLRYLGLAEQIDASASKLKPQNPGGPMAKVINPDEMARALSQLDPLGLDRPTTVERARPTAVKTIVVSSDLMVMPVPGVMEGRWRELLGGSTGADPQTGLSQRELRQWMRRYPNHRKLAWVQHPLARAHSVFCQSVLPRRPRSASIRQRLRNRYNIPLPEDWPGDSYDIDAHRDAFSAFLGFLKPCLAGQTSLPASPDWAAQLATLQSMARFALPDRVMRVERLEKDLGELGLSPTMQPATAEPFALEGVYTPELENLCREAYRRDYLFFGYGDWPDHAA